MKRPSLVINGIDFNERLDNAKELIHILIMTREFYAEVKLMPENPMVYPISEWFIDNADLIFGIPEMSDYMKANGMQVAWPKRFINLPPQA